MAPLANDAGSAEVPFLKFYDNQPAVESTPAKDSPPERDLNVDEKLPLV